jgi:hypothetical protein
VALKTPGRGCVDLRLDYAGVTFAKDTYPVLQGIPL